MISGQKKYFLRSEFPTIDIGCIFTTKYSMKETVARDDTCEQAYLVESKLSSCTT